MPKRREAAEENGLLVVGRRSVVETLSFTPENVKELWVSVRGKHHDEVALAKQVGVPVVSKDEETLSRTLGDVLHQGVVALLRRRDFSSVDEVIAASGGDVPSLLVAVDDIQDPQNFGSILRAAECFGADGVLWSKNRGVSLTPTVTKVSVGATELVRLVPAANLRDSLKKLKNAGYWVCATAMSAEAHSVSTFEFPSKCVVVLGSEGKGVQPLILKEADFSIAIPMSGRIESLNVSQATAVVLAAYRRCHPAK